MEASELPFRWHTKMAVKGYTSYRLSYMHSKWENFTHPPLLIAFNISEAVDNVLGEQMKKRMVSLPYYVTIRSLVCMAKMDN